MKAEVSVGFGGRPLSCSSMAGLINTAAGERSLDRHVLQSKMSVGFCGPPFCSDPVVPGPDGRLSLSESCKEEFDGWVWLELL